MATNDAFYISAASNFVRRQIRMCYLVNFRPLRRLGSATVYLVLSVAIIASASAQDAPIDAPGCAAAVAKLQPDLAPASLIHGLADIMNCPERGPVALARLWETPPSDSAALETLSNVTAFIRDSRVVPAVVKNLEDARMPRPVRLAALVTSVRLYSPDRHVIFKQRPGEEAEGTIYVLMGGWVHPMGRDGASPITPADRDRLMAALTRISKDDPDPGFSNAVWQVLVRLGVGTN
jgi:hypothetical protein